MENAKKQIVNVIKAFQRKNPEYSIKVKTLLEAKPSYVDKNVKISGFSLTLLKKVENNAPKYSLLPGFLDMRFFVNDAKINCINYGVRRGNLHGDDEFVYVSTIFDNTKILIYTFLNSELAEE